MLSIYSLSNMFPARCATRKSRLLSSSKVILDEISRHFADTPKIEPSKQAMVDGTENEARVRVRRARPADVPRILNFVRENASLAWPGLVNAPNTPTQIVLSDYVARTLAQGHSMLAEQQVEKRGWAQIRGLALSTSVCSWDATLLEKWAHCIRCSRSRKLMLLTAHCLRAPELHYKYRVLNVLQVVLIVPLDAPAAAEVIQMLVKNSIQRGRELDFPILRFDVTDTAVAKALDSLNLKKEYEFNYEVLPNANKIFNTDVNDIETDKLANSGKLITVYTAFPHAEI